MQEGVAEDVEVAVEKVEMVVVDDMVELKSHWSLQAEKQEEKSEKSNRELRK